MAAALERWHDERDARTHRMRRLRDRLEAGLVAALGARAVVRHGPADPDRRLPQTTLLGFPGRDGNALLMQLDLAGVRASQGSACASGSPQASPTLLAMGVPEDLARASVRFSLGAFTTEAEVDDAVRRIARALGAAQG
jgi:cysteine desulfurase